MSNKEILFTLSEYATTTLFVWSWPSFMNITEKLRAKRPMSEDELHWVSCMLLAIPEIKNDDILKGLMAEYRRLITITHNSQETWKACVEAIRERENSIYLTHGILPG